MAGEGTNFLDAYFREGDNLSLGFASLRVGIRNKRYSPELDEIFGKDAIIPKKFSSIICG